MWKYDLDVHIFPDIYVSSKSIGKYQFVSLLWQLVEHHITYTEFIFLSAILFCNTGGHQRLISQ